MGLSAQYHYAGIGEQERLKAYMGDINKEFQRPVKGEKPQTPEATFRADFVALGLTPAKDWEEYYEVSAKLASDVTQKAKITMRLRKQALKCAAAARLRKKGLFADREWQTHQDQIEGYDKAWVMAEKRESEIEKYRAMWLEESKLYARDPNGYKWKDPSKLLRRYDVTSEDDTKSGLARRVQYSRLLDPRDNKLERRTDTNEEWEAMVANARANQETWNELQEVWTKNVKDPRDNERWKPAGGRTQYEVATEYLERLERDAEDDRKFAAKQGFDKPTGRGSP